MSSGNGVDNLKSLMTLAKLGAISVLQAISKDGFQPSDIVAPLGSKQFMDALEANVSIFAAALPELKHAGFTGWASLGFHAKACLKDVSTEFELAYNKMEKLGQVK